MIGENKVVKIRPYDDMKTVIMAGTDVSQLQMPVSTQLHHELLQQAQNMSQKVALMLDERMLSFTEIIQCVQIVTAHLLKKITGVQQNEIVHHMLQRSVELPIAL
ncbi:unnamed protein product [Adineta ricciae]|uniref:Uncharacterized protein n=1 Tax=Adineta ricciae TaxID=249248 RepID=A0A814VLL8_ADIRI|nr:unnamed protein product [Adineta ricciae]